MGRCEGVAHLMSSSLSLVKPTSQICWMGRSGPSKTALVKWMSVMYLHSLQAQPTPSFLVPFNTSVHCLLEFRLPPFLPSFALIPLQTQTQPPCHLHFPNPFPSSSHSHPFGNLQAAEAPEGNSRNVRGRLILCALRMHDPKYSDSSLALVQQSCARSLHDGQTSQSCSLRLAPDPCRL